MIRTLFFIALTVLTVYSRAAEYNVLDFGAKNNGRDLTTFEIQKAIDKCHSEGGGCVFVPAGEYLVGTLNLKSNVEFHFETGAVLKATTDLSQYQKNNEHLAGVFIQRMLIMYLLPVMELFLVRVWSLWKRLWRKELLVM